jgi:hypothetical protein
VSSRDVLIEVGALGPAFGHDLPEHRPFEGDQFLDQPRELAWEARKKAGISASLTASLGEVIDEAAAQLGVRINPGPMSSRVPCIAFDGGGPYAGFIRIVESDGQAGWALRWSDIQIGELIASAEAGFVAGDPRRPLFWPVIPQAVFTDVAGAFLYMWAMWEHYLAARETGEIVRSIIQRLRRGRAAGAGAIPGGRNAAWHDALRRVNELMTFLEEPRTTEEVAAYMKVSHAEAEGTMLAFGFIEQQGGTWRQGGDPASEILREAVLELKREGPESLAPDEPGPRHDARIREAESSVRSDDTS